MKPVSSTSFAVMASVPEVTARTEARVTIDTTSPRMPSAADKIFSAKAGPARCEGRRSGNSASNVLSSCRYSQIDPCLGGPVELIDIAPDRGDGLARPFLRSKSPLSSRYTEI